jgi:HD-like signal output (HDOD) protein
MHDIGRLGFLRAYPKESASILSREHANLDAVLRAEREELNIDHGRAGAWLVGNWAFPKDFAEICEHHHDPLKESDSEVLKLVKIACNIADMIGFPAVRCQEEPSATWRPGSRTGRNSLPSMEHLRGTVTARLAAFER